MIEGISLQNFKAFKNLPLLQARPITVLCGTNSSGKSSILQSILLLKQTFESQSPNQTMLLNGRFVHLGVFENIVHQKDLQQSVTFDFSFQLSPQDVVRSRGSHSIPLNLYLENLILGPGRGIAATTEANYTLHYKVSVKSAVGDGRATEGKKAPVRPVIVDHLECRIQRRTGEEGHLVETSVGLALGPDGAYVATWSGLPNPFARRPREDQDSESQPSSGVLGELSVEVANLFPISINLRSSKVKREEQGEVPTALVWFFRMLNDILLGIFSSYTYIGPLREEPSRRYIYEDEIVEIGIKGENAAYIYLTEQERTLPDHYVPSGNEAEPFIMKRRPRLSTAVNQWLDIMDIHELKPEATNEVISLNLNASTSPRTRVNIADVGFGVSQIFPIIVEGLRMPKGNTLLLEQPEIHLHPNLQMQMADYFLCLALSGKKVIVETHSDHIVNRLVRRIVEDKGQGLSKLVGMFFVRASSSGSVVEEVQINENEGVVNWPRDFFDQTANEQERIIQAAVRRREERRQRKQQDG